MDDKKHQRKVLEAIYTVALMAPVLKPNPKYSIGKFEGLTCYISYDDIMNLKFSIRVRPKGEFNLYDSQPREIIAEYGSLRSLIDDDWQLA